jgi:hypothetical protein
MKQFSLGNAWSSGVAFVSRDAMNMAIIIIGMGVIAPTILQYALIGGSMGTMNPAMMGQAAAMGGGAALAGAFLLAMLLSYLLQFGSYFGAWRLGFGPGESIGGAVVYGLICAVLLMVAFIVLIIVMALVAQAGAPGILLATLLVGIPLLIIFAAVYTVIVAAFAMVMFLVLLVMLAFGSSLGNMNPALALTGGGALGMLIGLALVALMFFLAVRFSCTVCVMADRKTFNLLTGLTESWRLTASSQGRIAAYLALLGVILCVGFFVVSMFVGAGMMASMGSSGTVPNMGLGMVLLGLVFGIPVAYLLVLVPAGIYRELSPTVPAAAVFA